MLNKDAVSPKVEFPVPISALEYNVQQPANSPQLRYLYLMDWINTLQNVVDKIKHQFHAHHLDSLLKIKDSLLRFCSQAQSSHLDRYLFQKFLASIGVFLKTQELRTVFDAFDTDKNQLVSTQQFIQAIQSSTTPRRIKIVQDLWNWLSNGRLQIPAQQLKNRFRAYDHPNAKARKITPENALLQFQKQIQGKEQINQQQFKSLFRQLNAVCPSDQQSHFQRLIKAVWGLQYTGERMQQRINQLEVILYEKIREKTRTLSNQKITTNKAFFYFDLDHLRRADFLCFVKALQRFGCVFADQELRTFFNKYDVDRSGYLQYQQLSNLFFKIGAGRHLNVQFQLHPLTMTSSKMKT